MSRFPQISSGGIERLDSLIGRGFEAFPVEIVVITAPEPNDYDIRYDLRVVGDLVVTKPRVLALDTGKFTLRQVRRVETKPQSLPIYSSDREDIFRTLTARHAEELLLLTGYENSRNGSFSLPQGARHIISAYDMQRQRWLFGVVLPLEPSSG